MALLGSVGLRKPHLKVGQQSETALLYVVIRDLSNTISPFHAYPFQVQPVIRWGLVDLCLCLLGPVFREGHL